MYASTTMFSMPSGMRKKMEQLADQMLTGMRQMPGFVSITFVMDEEANEYGGIAIWKTKEDAKAALERTGSELKKALADTVIGPLRRKLFDVYEPHA